MSASSSRFFQNITPDYRPGTPTTLDRQNLKEQVLLTAHLVLKKAKSDKYDGGLYVGPAGLTYMFWHLAQHPNLMSADERNELVAMAKDALNNHLHYFGTLRRLDRNDPAAFLLGKGGVNAVGAIFGKMTGNNDLYQKSLGEFVAAAQICKPLGFRHGGSDELFVGRAGYLCGALWLQQNLAGDESVPKEDLHSIWRAIVESGKAYASRNRSPCPLMYAYYDTEYLGAAHGLCSILQILLSFPEFCRDHPQDEQLIRQTIDYYLTIQEPSGNFPSSLDEVKAGIRRTDTDSLVHWCHGAPGAVYMFAKAYLHFNDEKYLNASIACGEVVWKQGLLKKGPGICHGIAGNAYVFLVLHRLQGKEPKHLYRATKFAEFLNTETFKTQARSPDCPFSLYEGLAGTVCYLADLLHPNQAVFPFFDIHYNYQ